MRISVKGRNTQVTDDLRRQLEAQGIELQRLDISYSGDERPGNRSAEADSRSAAERTTAVRAALRS